MKELIMILLLTGVSLIFISSVTKI